MTTDLVEFNVDEQALAEIQDPSELKDYRDKAEAVRQYVKNQGVGLDGQNRYAEAKIWIERRLGQVLSDEPKNPGGQAEHKSYLSHDVTGRIPTLTELGIERMQAHRWRVAAELSKEILRAYIAKTIAKDGELTSKEVYRLAQKEKQRLAREARKENVATGQQEHGIEIHHGDFREVCQRIKADSIDLVFTDPPYGKRYLPLYADLAEVSNYVLRPGGLCLSYSGHVFFPQVLNSMNEHLTYAWICTIRHSGGNLRFRNLHIYNTWKPIIMFYKPPLDPWWEWFDDSTTGGKEKTEHKWQQAIAEAEYYISRLCPPGGTVFDPFLGSGTTALAAQRLGYQFIGCDVDADAVAVTLERLKNDHHRTTV